MWTPIILIDKSTGRKVHISIIERELYLAGFFTFEHFWDEEQEESDKIIF